MRFIAIFLLTAFSATSQFFPFPGPGRAVSVTAPAGLTFGTAGTVTTTGTTAPTVAYPASISAGDMLVLAVANRPSWARPSVPSGWTTAPGYTAAGGKGTEGADSGLVRVSVFTKKATGSESGSLTLSIPGGTSVGAQMLRYTTAANKDLEPAATNGMDLDNSSTAWSVGASSLSASGGRYKVGIMGDSGLDEYQADDLRGSTYSYTTRNPMELLAEWRGRDFDFGQWEVNSSPRRSGFSRNWALSGSTAGSVNNGVANGTPGSLADQYPGLAAQVEAEEIDTVIIWAGANDWALWNQTYQDVYNGTISGTALTNKINSILSNITNAVDAVIAAGAQRVLVASTIDPNSDPGLQATYTNATFRQRVTDGVDAVNAGIDSMLASRPKATLVDRHDQGLLVAAYGFTGTGWVIDGEAIDATTLGDEPHHFLLADGSHYSTAASGMVANLYLIDAMNDAFSMGITPLTESEIVTAAGMKTTGPAKMSNPGIAVGDTVIVATAVNSDHANTAFASESLSATGTTFGTVTERTDTAVGTGNDLRLIVTEHPVTAGPASADPSYSGTHAGTLTTAGTNAGVGASVAMRLRVVDSEEEPGGGGLVSFSDDFNRSDADSLGANWTEVLGDADISSNRLVIETSGYGNVWCVYNTPLSTTNQYLKVAFPAGSNEYPQVILRYTDASSPFYFIEIDGYNGLLTLYRRSSASGSSTQIGSSLGLGSVPGGHTVGFTVSGTGASTVIRVWLDPVGDSPDSATSWGGDTTPNQTFSNPGGSAVDSGLYVGLGGQASVSGRIFFDSVFGGDIP